MRHFVPEKDVAVAIQSAREISGCQTKWRHTLNRKQALLMGHGIACAEAKIHG